MLAIIGGSGLTQLSNLKILHRQIARTPFGEPSGPLIFGEVNQKQVVFLARHGYGHTIPPHQINFRANLWALREGGAKAVLAVGTVGGIRADLRPGDLLIPDQLIDYSWGRPSTFHEGDGCSVTHVDFTEPYDGPLRQRLLTSARAVNVAVKEGGVYGVTQGPRLETAAEITRMERDGVDVVGMTAMPEAVLARELSLPYAAINVVSNYAAGRGDSAHEIAFDFQNQSIDEVMGRVRLVIEHLVTQCSD